jgi:hypothetical protein
MISSRRIAVATVLSAVIAAPAALAQEPSKDVRPKLVASARPEIAIAPARVVVTAELVGGSDDFEEYYCPTVVWNWGDGTRSEASSDCDPYVAGKSEIKRRFTNNHQFSAGNYSVVFSLKQGDKEVASATVRVQIRSGAADFP